MARTRAVGDGIVVHAAPDADAVPFAGVSAIPAAFTAVVDRPALPCIVTMTVRVVDGQPVVEDLRLTRRARTRTAPAGPTISGALIRTIPVATLLAEVTKLAPLTLSKREGKSVWMPPMLSDEDVAVLRSGGRDRWQLTDDHLRAVAAVYLANPHRPVMAVAETFSKPRPTASRWVVAARERGFLTRTTTEPARRRRAR